MKSIAILSIGEPTGKSLADELSKLFGDYTDVRYYTENTPLDFNASDVLGISTGDFVIKNNVAEKIREGMEHIPAQRVINHQHIHELISLRKGIPVLLVNDCKETANSAIRQLLSLGLDHVTYYPYYPGIADYPNLEIAVTPGEPHLVPTSISKVIDIGIRQIDITTILEIAMRLGLMDKLSDTLSSKFVSEIINLLKKINCSAHEAIFMRDTLQTVSDCSKSGIALTDSDGHIVTANRAFLNMLPAISAEESSVSLNRMLSLSAEELLESKEVLKNINGSEVLVNRKKVDHPDGTPGYVYTFEDRKAIENLEIEIRRQTRKTEHVARYTYSDIHTVSPRTRETLDLSKKLAASDSTILIQGESGTGKELLAQAIHNSSARSSEPFVPVNFAALPMSLLESELFGYEEGAFTGAKRGGSKGLFEEAHGGTLFLDEIGDASMEFQIRLLRVLQEKQIRRVGGKRQIPIDVRIIAATNKSLLSEISQSRFREDLYYRLNVLPLRTQALRERKEDLLHLINHFISKYSKGRYTSVDQIADPGAVNALFAYDWPGNVRELINITDYLIQIKTPGILITHGMLPIETTQSLDSPSAIRFKHSQQCDAILQIIHAHGPVGRVAIRELAHKAGIALSEGEIRGRLSELCRLNYVHSGIGRQGTSLTEQGLHYLSTGNRQI